MKQHQSLSGYIREHLASIESRLSVGVRQEVIVQELASQGYQTTPAGFRNLLCRARKKVAKGQPIKTEKQEQKEDVKSAPKALPKVENALKAKLEKPAGFQYDGTKDESELI